MDNRELIRTIDVVIRLLSLHEATNYGTIEEHSSNTIFADMITNNLLATEILSKTRNELLRELYA